MGFLSCGPSTFTVFYAGGKTEGKVCPSGTGDEIKQGNRLE